MCFNISINKNKNIIESQIDAKFDENIIFYPKKHLSAFSNPLIPVVTSEYRNKIELFHWGLIPSWIKDADKANEIRRLTYNARIETAINKPSFSNSVKNKKCLIIADGFYEWETTSNGKVCHYVTFEDSNIFSFAGIWSDWLNNPNGRLIKTCSILTQRANPFMSKIHNVKNRQPVLLHKHNYHNWLNAGLDFQNILDESYDIKLRSIIVESPLKIS